MQTGKMCSQVKECVVERVLDCRASIDRVSDIQKVSTCVCDCVRVRARRACVVWRGVVITS